MGPLLRQPAGQNRGNLRGYRNRIGFRSEVALNQGFRANSGARSTELWTRNAVELGSFTTGARQRQFLWVFSIKAPRRTWSGPAVSRQNSAANRRAPYFLAGFAGVEAVA